MNEILLDIFYENGIVEIIIDYKNTIELFELDEKIDLISSQIKLLKTNKKIIGRCVVSENGKQHMKYKEYFKNMGSSYDIDYTEYYNLYINKINQLRNTLFELQVEKLFRKSNKKNK